jgi:hypothetical protein
VLLLAEGSLSERSGVLAAEQENGADVRVMIPRAKGRFNVPSSR